MELPQDVLRIIKEYSMPVTRPDWRTLHIMPFIVYKNEFLKVNQRFYRDLRHNRVFNWMNFIIIFNWYKHSKNEDD